MQNAHVSKGRVQEGEDVRVFLGIKKYSEKFNRAVDLGIYQNHSLLRKTVRTKSGGTINWHKKPHWNSATRSCRAILDLEIPQQRKRAHLIRDAIRKKNPSFNLLAGL